MQTQPPPRYKYADTVNQSVIYDAYVKYEEMKEAQDADDQKGGPGKQQKETNAAIKRLLAEKTVDKNAEVNKKLLKAAFVNHKVSDESIEICLANKDQLLCK